jgi:hypothetical protein
VEYALRDDSDRVDKIISLWTFGLLEVKTKLFKIIILLRIKN